MALPATASPADRQAAFAVLTANIAHYRRIFEQGRAIIDHAQHANGEEGPGAMEDPNSAVARFRDYRKNSNPELDMSFLDAFRRADKHLKYETSRRPSSNCRITLLHGALCWSVRTTVRVSAAEDRSFVAGTRPMGQRVIARGGGQGWGRTADLPIFQEYGAVSVSDRHGS